MPWWISGSLVGGTFFLLLLLEFMRPLRRSVEQKLRRNVRNFIVAALSAATVQLIERPLVMPLAELMQERGWGLVKLTALPVWLEVLLAMLLMDYTLYLWHILTHRVPFLWRFHQPHHVDLDMDASTALRFHFIEIALSVPWRLAQVALIGISPLTLTVWQTAVLLEVMFHHSNVALPLWLERWVSRFVVTPRMHGIHHSMIREEANSNWSSGLTIWDWLHGTLRLNVPQREITVGVPAFRRPEEVTLPKVMIMPLVKQQPSWQLPGEGEPSRLPSPLSRNHLLG